VKRSKQITTISFRAVKDTMSRCRFEKSRQLSNSVFSLVVRNLLLGLNLVSVLLAAN